MSRAEQAVTPAAGSENCLAIGTRLAEFEVMGVIGEGGFGIVYLAFDHSLQRTVAVKEYMPAALAARGADHGVSVRAKRHGDAFEAGLRSFINEARLLAQFDHAALIKVYRFWEQHGTAYMAMRFYEGQTFKNAVKDNPDIVDEAWLKKILKPILEALEALYKANILHRDISPENIMIQPNGDAVLLDFGAARQIVSGMAQSLTVILKPGYAPVEQYADDDSMQQGPWTDIYSLSAVMYSAIAQKAPPTAVGRMLNDPLEPLAQGDYPRFGKQFLAALDKGLAVRPEGRPQSIAEFAQLLGVDMSVRSHAQAAVRPSPAAPGAARGAAARPAPVKPQPASGTRPKLGWALAVGGVALALAGGVWFAAGDSAPPRVASTLQPAPVPASQAVSPNEEIVSWESLNRERAAVAAYAAPKPAVSAATKPKEAAAKAPAKPRDVAAVTDAKLADEGAAPATGTLNLSILPWGTVFVDGAEKGVSPPLKKLSLPAGRHKVRIVNPHFPEYVVGITVDAKKPAAVTRDFSAPAK